MFSNSDVLKVDVFKYRLCLKIKTMFLKIEHDLKSTHDRTFEDNKEIKEEQLTNIQIYTKLYRIFSSE